MTAPVVRGSGARARRDSPVGMTPRAGGTRRVPRPPRPGSQESPVARAPKRKPMQILRGIAVSPGVAIGPALVRDPRGLGLPARAIAPEAVAAELERLDRGLEAAHAAAQLDEDDTRRRLGPQYGDILAAHARMITDPTLRRDARARIERERIAAEHAVTEVLDEHAAHLEALSDSFLAARAADVRDVERRILEQLAGARPVGPANECAPSGVLLAHDLSPSQAAKLDPARVLGFATEAGGRASHTAIVAAALELPTVVGVGPFLDAARSCRTAIVDGDAGLVILDPDAPTLRRYRKAAAERRARFAGLADLAALPAQTRDGMRIGLFGNIEFPAEAAACRDRGAEGIGLYRTEFLYLGAERPPTEEEQFAAYAAVIRAMGGRPVTIRTLDLGADRLVSYSRTAGPETRNPSLGLRSIRLSLRDPALFRTQLRAILRASAVGELRVLFPLITTIEELRRARGLLREVADELRAEGVPVRADVPVGAMIEVPAAAVMADQLAKEVDFLSLGTNDLIQYTLAVDRTDETVAELYNAADPAVLRLIAMVVAAAAPRGLAVNVCGSMGGDPLYTMLLVGLGLRDLSMPPHQLPEVKRVIRAIDLERARAVAAEALRRDTAAAVTDWLRSELHRVLPDELVAPPGSHAD